MVTARVLQEMGRAMFPFFLAVSCNRTYALQWTRAVITANFTQMERLFRLVSRRRRPSSFGAGQTGYFIIFPAPPPVNLYTTGTVVVGRGQQAAFTTRGHRAVARDVLPLYRELALNRGYAFLLALAIRRGDRATVNCLVRKLIGTRALKVVEIRLSGIVLTFKYGFNQFPYRHLLVRNVE